MKTCRPQINPNNKEETIEMLMPFIKYTAKRLSWSLPSHMTTDDLVSVGLIALMRTIERFQHKKGSFRTYAEIRIKGAMIDELRAVAWVPRSLMNKLKTIRNARIKLENKYARPPDDHEVAESVQMPLDEYYRILQHTTSRDHARLEDFKSRRYTDYDMNIMQCISDPDAKSPFDVLENKNKLTYLTKLIDTLPEQQKKVLFLYYFKEHTLMEIGRVLNMTESRICQLRGKAINELKTRIHPSFM